MGEKVASVELGSWLYILYGTLYNVWAHLEIIAVKRGERMDVVVDI